MLDWKTPHDCFVDEHGGHVSLLEAEDPPDFYDYAAEYILDQLKEDD